METDLQLLQSQAAEEESTAEEAESATISVAAAEWQRLQQKWTLQQKKEYEKLEREQKNPYYSPLKVLNKTKQLQASEAAKIICDKIWF